MVKLLLRYTYRLIYTSTLAVAALYVFVVETKQQRSIPVLVSTRIEPRLNVGGVLEQRRYETRKATDWELLVA